MFDTRRRSRLLRLGVTLGLASLTATACSASRDDVAAVHAVRTVDEAAERSSPGVVEEVMADLSTELEARLQVPEPEPEPERHPEPEPEPERHPEPEPERDAESEPNVEFAQPGPDLTSAGPPEIFGDAPFRAIEEVLISPLALAEPWEAFFHGTSNLGRGQRENETSCDDYWAYGSLDSNYHGGTLWSDEERTGLQNFVYAMEDAAAVTAVLDAIAAMPARCPNVDDIDGAWSLTVHPLETNIDGVTSVAFNVDAENEQWIAARGYGSLLSVVQFVNWSYPEPAHPAAAADFETLVREMVRLTPLPGSEPQPSDVLRAAALVASDLGDIWSAGDVQAHQREAWDRSLSCDGVMALDDVFEHALLDVELRNERDGLAVRQTLSEFETSQQAATTVSTLIELAECGESDRSFVGWEIEVDRVQIIGASTAVEIVLRDVAGSASASYTVVAVDRHVVTMSSSALWDVPFVITTPIAETAAAKLLAALTDQQQDGTDD